MGQIDITGDELMNLPRFWAIVPAAGSGSRLGGETPKQYLELAGKPLIAHTLQSLLDVNEIFGVAVGLARNDKWWQASFAASNRILGTYVGGFSRAETVLRGLEYIKPHVRDGDWVLVHDVARPCVRSSEIKRLILERGDEPAGAIFALPVNDTIKQGNGHDRVEQTISRDNLWCAQTPQLFPFSVLLNALERSDLAAVTDDSSAVEAVGYKPRLLFGQPDNFKVTTRGDFELADLILRARYQGVDR